MDQEQSKPVSHTTSILISCLSGAILIWLLTIVTVGITCNLMEGSYQNKTHESIQKSKVVVEDTQVQLKIVPQIDEDFVITMHPKMEQLKAIEVPMKVVTEKPKAINIDLTVKEPELVTIPFKVKLEGDSLKLDSYSDDKLLPPPASTVIKPEGSKR